MGSAIPTMMPLVAPLTQRAYAKPREPAPMIRTRGGLREAVGREGPGRLTTSSSSMGASACGAIANYVSGGPRNSGCLERSEPYVGR